MSHRGNTRFLLATMYDYRVETYPMKLVLLVANVGSTSGTPGDSQNTVRCVLPPKTDKIDDENPGVFPDPRRKNVVFEVHGLSDEAMADFKAGKRVTVTVETEK